MIWVSHQVLATLGSAGATGLQFNEIAGAQGRSLENALQKLRSRKLVEYEGRRYRVTPAGQAFLGEGRKLTSGPRGPQPGKRLFKNTLRERVWRAIRIRRKFSALEIIPLATLGHEQRPESNVGKYLRALKLAGFLAELPTRQRGDALTSNGFKRYLLVRDSGPQAPRWLPKRGMVFDPNDGEEYPL